MTKEEFARLYLAQVGNRNPQWDSIQTIVYLIDNDEETRRLYDRANARMN